MTRLIAIANPQGGSGKTTTTINLAACLVERGHKVLVVDVDPLASLTERLGYPSAEQSRSLYDALASSIPAAALILPTQDGFDLIPAHASLSQATALLTGSRQRLLALRSSLEPLRDRYDYILLDCQSDAGILTGGTLAAADEVLIPLSAVPSTPQSLGWFLSVVQRVTDLVSPNLRVTGIFFNRCDSHAEPASTIADQVRSQYGATLPLLATGIPNSADVRDAGRDGQSILKYDAHSTAAEAYRALAIEIDEGQHVTIESELDSALAQARQFFFSESDDSSPNDDGAVVELTPQRSSDRSASAAPWDEKIRECGQALRLDPGNPDRRADLDRCIQDALADSAGIESLISSAQFLESIGENQFAHMLFQRIVDLDTRQEKAWIGHARTTDDPLEARHSIRRCLEINPRNESARGALRNIQESARQEARRLVEQAADDARLGKREAARAALTRACELDPVSDRAVLELARVAEDLATASALAHKALKLNPQNTEARELCFFLDNSEEGLTAPAPRRRSRALPVIAMAVLAVVIIALAFFTGPSLIAMVLPSAPAQAIPTEIIFAADFNMPSATPSPDRPTATIVLQSATTVPTLVPTRVPVAATPRPATVAAIPTLTRVPTLTATVPSTVAPTLAAALRYDAVILREPHDQQLIQQDTVTLEWETVHLALDGDHYELKLKAVSSSGWEKSFRVAGGRFVLAVQDSAGYGDYLWSISIFDAQQRVVSPASEVRRLPWQPRPPRDQSNPEPPPDSQPPTFLK